MIISALVPTTPGYLRKKERLQRESQVCNSLTDLTIVLGAFFYFVLCFSDFQRKKKTLKALKRKALDRNPDEFYFNMVNTRLEV